MALPLADGPTEYYGFNEELREANMATITNKTYKSLSISLPGGKKLRLGPLKSGEISPKAIDHPPVQKLIEAGEVEIFGPEHESRRADGGSKGSRFSSGGKSSGGGIRRTGDR